MTMHDRLIAEAMAALGAVGGLMHSLPVLATLLAALWYGIQIYDRLRHRRPEKRHDEGPGHHHPPPIC